MRETTYSFANNILNKDKITELNKLIHSNFVQDIKDRAATGAIKSSQVKFIKLGMIHNFLAPLREGG